MAATSAIKIRSDAALQELSLTDEDYLAYRAGIDLASGVSGVVGSLATTGTEAEEIGTITDTLFTGNTGDPLTPQNFTQSVGFTYVNQPTPATHSMTADPAPSAPVGMEIGDTITLTVSFDPYTITAPRETELLFMEIQTDDFTVDFVNATTPPGSSSPNGAQIIWSEFFGTGVLSATWILTANQAGTGLSYTVLARGADGDITPEVALDTVTVPVVALLIVDKVVACIFTPSAYTSLTVTTLFISAAAVSLNGTFR